MKARFSAAALQRAWPTTRRCDASIWARISGWTDAARRTTLRVKTHGAPATTAHETRPETHPDALAAAGDQAAAHVDPRARRHAQPGGGGEPAARGSAGRGH